MMDDKGDLEILRAAFWSLSTEARPSDVCPEPGALWDGLRGELPPNELRTVVDHTAACAACAEAWRIGLELEGEVAAEESAPAAARSVGQERRATAAWWRYAAVAAMVAGVIGVSQIGDWTNRNEPTRFRDAARMGIVSLVPEGTQLAPDAFVLRWDLQIADEVARYEVQVMTEDLRPVSTARDLEVPSYQVPESDLAPFAPGVGMLWQVEAVLADGGRLASETFGVRLQ